MVLEGLGGFTCVNAMFDQVVTATNTHPTNWDAEGNSVSVPTKTSASPPDFTNVDTYRRPFPHPQKVHQPDSGFYRDLNTLQWVHLCTHATNDLFGEIAWTRLYTKRYNGVASLGIKTMRATKTGGSKSGRLLARPKLPD